MAVKNHNFRFNEEKEAERKAWKILHSEEVKEDFRSQNEFVIAAINDYYARHLALKRDPYLESREKEDTAKRLDSAVSSLPDMDRMLVSMRFGISCEPQRDSVIAQVLGVDVPDISRMLETALAKLRRFMASADNELLPLQG